MRWTSIAAICMLAIVGCSDDGGEGESGSTTTTEGPASGEVLRWSESIERPFGLLIADDLVVVAGSTLLTAYDIESGQPVWDAEIGGTVGVTPMAVDGDTIVIARPSDVAQAFSVEDGATVPDYGGPVPNEAPQSHDSPPGYSFGDGELRFEGEVIYSDPSGESRFGPTVARIEGFSILNTFNSLIVVSDDGSVLLDEAFTSEVDDESGWVVDEESGFAAAWLADGRLYVVQVPI